MHDAPFVQQEHSSLSLSSGNFTKFGYCIISGGARSSGARCMSVMRHLAFLPPLARNMHCVYLCVCMTCWMLTGLLHIPCIVQEQYYPKGAWTRGRKCETCRHQRGSIMDDRIVSAVCSGAARACGPHGHLARGTEICGVGWTECHSSVRREPHACAFRYCV